MGDIIDLWQASVGNIVRDAFDVVRELITLDHPIVYILGNHDMLLDEFSVKSKRGNTSLYVIPRWTLVEVGDRKIALLHGHEIDPTFWLTLGLWRLLSYVYSLSEALIYLPGPLEWWIACIAAVAGVLLLALSTQLGLLTVPLRLALIVGGIMLLIPLVVLFLRRAQTALWYSLLPIFSAAPGRAAVRGKPVSHVVKRRAFKSWLKRVEKRVGRLDCVVFGHTHVPGLMKLGSLLVANAGCWVAGEQVVSCTYLRITHEGVELRRWQEGKSILVAREVWR